MYRQRLVCHGRRRQEPEARRKALDENRHGNDDEQLDGRNALQRMLEEVGPAMVNYFNSQSFENTVSRILEKKGDQFSTRTTKDANPQSIQLHRPRPNDSHHRSESNRRGREGTETGPGTALTDQGRNGQVPAVSQEETARTPTVQLHRLREALPHRRSIEKTNNCKRRSR